MTVNKDSLELQKEILELLEAQEAAMQYNKIELFFPDKGPYRRDLYPKHIEFMNAGAAYKQRAFIAANRVGKEVRITEPVLTPTGWKQIGKLSVGDKICDPCGGTANVCAVYDQGIKQLYRVWFNDGTYIDCGLEHQWMCKGPSERFRKKHKNYNQWQIRTLQEIIDISGYEPSPTKRHSIPVIEKIDYQEEDLPLDPYTVGALLGDGSIKNTCVFHSADPEMLAYLCFGCPNRIEQKPNSQCKSYYFTNKVELLKKAGIYGLTSENKYVPKKYKCHSKRIEVLRGLLDTDGYTNKSIVEFCSISKQLAQDVADIARSLGIRCVLKEKKTSWWYEGIKKNSIAYKVSIWNTHIPLFKLKRKLEQQNLTGVSKNGTENIIVKIEKIDEAEARCITVDSKNNTYIISNYVVTHNTLTGAVEATFHLTGRYPKWWKGRVFRNPIYMWASGESNASTKKIQQAELLGEELDFGSGMIPKEYLLLDKIRMKPGVPGAVDSFYVKHISGGYSRCDFLSYEQGWKKFQGTKVQFIWLDEEPSDPKIYTECLTRTMDKQNPGRIMCTFTPLSGLSDVVLDFIPNGKFPADGASVENPYKFVTRVGWDDVPHLSEEEKEELLKSYPEHEKKARTMGIPALGSGAIYPYDEEKICVEPFKIPDYWPRAFGMDVGWTKTAAIWGAQDPESKIIYLYSEHYEGKAEPPVHASAVKARGDWIPGAIDSGAKQASQIDGRTLMDLYLDEGLDLTLANKGVEAGILRVSQLLGSGQLKIFTSLTNTRNEYRVYRRDEDGKIVKKEDHLMDAMRYLIIQFEELAMVSPEIVEQEKNVIMGQFGRDIITGY